MKDNERFLIILISLLVCSIILFLWDQNGRLQKTIQILHDDRKEAIAARDSAVEKLKAAEARVATDMHAISVRHNAQATTLASCTADRAALLEAMRDVMAASLYPLPEGKGQHKNMVVGVANNADVNPQSVAVHLKNTVDALKADAKATAARVSECVEARRELSVDCTAKAKAAEADLKVRLASLQRARDKMKEMDATIETCNAQLDDVKGRELKLQQKYDNQMSLFSQQLDCEPKRQECDKRLESMKLQLVQCAETESKLAVIEGRRGMDKMNEQAARAKLQQGGERSSAGLAGRS